MIFAAAVLAFGLATASAFVPIIVPAIRISDVRAVSTAGAFKQASARERQCLATTPAMTFLDPMGLIPQSGSVSAVMETHAHAVSSAGMLLTEEAVPPNIYGPIALGGVVIMFSGVISAYIVSLIITRMPEEALKELADELAGGEAMRDLEREGEEQTKRFQDIERDLEDKIDPSKGVALRPEGKQARKVEAEAARARETNIAAMEDEYGD